ncbi:class A beta-lactamase [Bosea sp. 124]|uniref:class A beta-lactamase n=1 Tax=Bosea sp. 124 TaxID=2135642 RepID=UPI000D42FCB3|nr:class A beta-lactamase [Bosea sp. 124]PTM41253.1 beta-lactamase class A [Bosea sp. 124]
MLRFAAIALACLAASQAVSTNPARADWDKAKLDREIVAIERQSKGRLGVALLDLKDSRTWSHRGTESFPMQSVFKWPLAIAVLQAVEAGRFKLDEKITIRRSEFSLYHSPLAKAFEGESNAYPLRELIALAAGESDNTAADILMREIGGPRVVRAMLAAGGIQGITVDRYERQFQPEVFGLPGFGWNDVIDEPAYRAKLAALDPAKRKAALQTALKDRRDSATPEASVLFVEAQARGNWLRGPAHNALIDRIVTETKSGADRIRAGLPEGARFAHKTGLGLTMDGINHATNDIGLVNLPNGRVFAIAVYLAGSTADARTREAAHAAVAKLAVAALR